MDSILLIDSDANLHLKEVSLKSNYKVDVHSCNNQTEAIQILKEIDRPGLIVMDYQYLMEQRPGLYHYLESESIDIPLLVTSQDKLDHKQLQQFPFVTSFVSRPVDSKVFIELVQQMLKPIKRTSEFVPVKISLLLNQCISGFDLFLKLSNSNFVRIIHKDEPFLESDANKLLLKGIFELFIRHEDSDELLRYLESDLIRPTLNSHQDVNRTLDNLENFEKVAKIMGWSATTLNKARESVAAAVKILAKNESIFGAIRLRLTESTSPYSKHISLMTFLVTAFSSDLELIGESAGVKLALAAMIHDMAVDESYYENIDEWNKKGRDRQDKTLETIRYRMHPFEAAKLVKELDSFSNDVDQIIMQHHEQKDGKGFPRGLDSHRIGQLSALFIIVENLVEFLDRGGPLENSIADFMTWGREQYSTGQFKKIYQAIEVKLKN